MRLTLGFAAAANINLTSSLASTLGQLRAERENVSSDSGKERRALTNAPL